MLDSKLEYLIKYLLLESDQDIGMPKTADGKFELYRGLVNVRPPMAAESRYIDTENEFLTEYIAEKGITDINDLTPAEDGIYLWQGDITTLKCGAIVNAANSQMTGCYSPNHNCIDNCIHTFAGVRLRYKCAALMEEQGHYELPGRAKLTPAYNLPSDYVIHTVGPIVYGTPTDEQCELLKSCYVSCLDCAVQNGIESIAFCCISTGVFGFPQRPAARIAVDTVREYLKSHDIKVKVIFDVFDALDYTIYSSLLNI